ncbi:MAG: twin-arginine translocase TatA/TatE family subunit [Gammaproteobacteria bacterium]|nr:twin-arginine translocase TatA/TatE family subunit [Gammaproteobacteria bacterium]
MGFSGIGPGSLILILIIVVLLFGTKRLRTMGSDLGSALKNFKKAVKEGESEEADAAATQEKLEGKNSVIEGEATNKDKSKT